MNKRQQNEVGEIVHRGFAHSRTLTGTQFEDAAREKALADRWEDDNPPVGSRGTQPVLNALIPDCTQRDASVAATVVQWMGSQVGFAFLQEALAQAGLEIVKSPKKTH